MVFLKVILLSLSLILLSLSGNAGEPGTEQTQQIEKDKNLENQKPVAKKKSIKQKLVNTDIQLPKNPIDTIFLQPLGKPIDPRYANLSGNCIPAQKNYDCKIVVPKKKSTHFNKYHYYLNANKHVYGVIAFRDHRIGNVDHCRSLIGEWREYFNNFEFETKTKEENMDQLVLTTSAIKPSEIYMSCYPESYRDIKSYFSLKLFIDEN
ncbi:MAG: hypothetical protein MRY23_04855 [Pelagibacteraceae bacterium]|nr:hypothetical protein [Pelagibacteraceae bacterium]MCI5079092.1 hypothetical protein [Pelagibacteraceae bacterium]